MFDYLELVAYFALSSIPKALPLTVLLSSVMVFGDMAERYELTSIKSAGISFMRILRPGLMVASIVFTFSVLTSNLIKPDAYKGFFSKMRDMKTNKLTFAFDEKIFNQEFKNFSIRIGEKDGDGRQMNDVMIYDHTDSDASVVNMIRAKKGEMYTTPDRKFLVMDLFDGYQVKEIREGASTTERQRYYAYARPMIRYTFSSLRKVFNLTDMLDLNQVNISYKDYEMMNTLELINVVDSLNTEQVDIKENNVQDYVVLRRDATLKPGGTKKTNKAALTDKMASVTKPSNLKTKQRGPSAKKSALKVGYADKPIIDTTLISDSTVSLFELITSGEKKEFLERIDKNAISIITSSNNQKNASKLIDKLKARYKYTLHEIYSLATVCIIFLFIGAPSGAIIKKGGFGYPLLIAIGFYIAFILTNIIGKKLSDSGAVDPIIGAWFPCIVLLPFAVYLSWRALHDNRPFVNSIFRRLPLLRKGS